MHRHLSTALAVLVIAYLVIAVYSVAFRGQREQKEAQNLLTNATQEIIEHPTQAAYTFQLAGQQAALGLKRISLLPWWSRILTPLPPFRYRVETLQADIQLASAGNQACQLRQSFPNLFDPKASSTSEALSTPLNRSNDWYQSHEQEISTLEKTLRQALLFMPTPPAGIVRLNKNLATTITTVNQLESSLVLKSSHVIISLHDEKEHSLGEVLAQGNHFSGVQFQEGTAIGAVSIIIPNRFIHDLVKKEEPLELTGVAPKTITEESLINGQSTSREALSALMAGILSHPEHLKDFQSINQQYPLSISTQHR